MIPLDRLERNPLITEAGYRLLNRILQHPCAPKWNYVVGDRIESEDLPPVEKYRRSVREDRGPCEGVPPPVLLDWAERLRERVPLVRESLPEGFNLAQDWAYVPTMDREDLALRIERIVPADENLSRLIVYDTSGTTGHALKVPHHPRAMAQNQVLIEYALERYGVRPPFGPDAVACVNLGAQEAETVVFANIFTIWNQAGFAKVNLHPKEWGSLEHAREFFRDFAPLFLTGDPVGFAELLSWEIPVRSAAILSTATALSDGLKSRLEASLGCPVVDWYSVTETGPIAYACPAGRGLHVLPHDIFVEALDAEGHPVHEGERGELAVSGGHNPYVPLLRYRTGDWGRIERSVCPCGEVTPRILDLEGRTPVFFRSAEGSVVNAVDIGRALRRFPVVQHEVVQRADGSCEVALRGVQGLGLDLEQLESALRELLGAGIALSVRLDETLGERLRGGKVQPYRSEIIL